MPKEHVLVNDIIADHRERMLNLKKYYPFFRLSEISFSWFREGRYENLDMGYILMAVLRFFIEENNFRERDVTYPMYYEFMSGCIKRDFGITLSAEDNKQLVDYIFDKLKNDGRPFSFEYYDPVDRVKKVSRIRLLESRIKDGTVWYSISSEGIEFYLDTKEIRDESKISVEQLLLEKMIESRDFKGGAQVVKRINEEVERLRFKKNQVVELLTADVFAGIEAYEKFFETGIRWFDEEQKLFVKNKELIEAALKRAQSEKLSGDAKQFYQTTGEIYRLDTELKVAMNNHAKLLRACTELGIQADEIIRKSKLSRLKSRFDFKSVLDIMIKKDTPEILEYIMKPFFGLNINKTFDLSKIEDLLSYRPDVKEEAERLETEEKKDIVFQDEIDEKRFEKNVRTLMLIFLQMAKNKGEFCLRDYNEVIKNIFGDEVFLNGDYYAFLVHLCQKTDYFLVNEESEEETFLDAIIKKYLEEKEFGEYAGMHIVLQLAGGDEEEIYVNDAVSVTNFVVKTV